MPHSIENLARDWPGKTVTDRSGLYQEHPALWHMLDVGAVASCLLQLQPLYGPEIDQALACLVTLHDLGKFSSSFRDMLRHGAPQHRRHWEHTGFLLSQFDDALHSALGGDKEPRRILVEAIVGHHGGPRAKLPFDALNAQKAEIGEAGLDASYQALTGILSLFSSARLDGLDETTAKQISWQINGLTIQSDWIGSNSNWFPPAPLTMSLTEYWRHAQILAQSAVKSAQQCPTKPAQHSAAKILSAKLSPRPMQAVVLDAALSEGPTLAIIEDSTGAGKTEAALMLALRMMQADKGAGLFFALPTMATANAMLSRLEKASTCLFDTAPTLALSHGRSRLSQPFRDIQNNRNPESGPHCGEWLASDRRRVLLADIGVGTIDQALLAVLPTRFNGLRLRALSRRILVVDEAHDYDPYMQAQLERVLQMQARLGGSAIVMTATLPSPKKARFEAAFQSGLRGRSKPARRGRKAPEPQAPAPYPALTLVSAKTELTAVNSGPQARRRVAISRLADVQSAVDLIVQSRAAGAACVWIRNAVDDAIAAVDLLHAEGINADLLHARFALCDRLDKEVELQCQFGASSPSEARCGRVLVATQVVEQSLDLDFDVMITDLAPMGAMIQRAGRLWRHMSVRPADKRPVPGPKLHVISPDPDLVSDDRWLHHVLDRGAYTYDTTVAWRSAKALFDAGELQEPEGLRALIEAVEGREPLLLPDVLEMRSLKHEGEELQERRMALNTLIDAHDAFDQPLMAEVWDDEVFPTRLGVPQVTVAIARWEAGVLVPLAMDPLDPWALSEVQISAVRFEKLGDAFPDQSASEIAAVKANWPEARAQFTWVAPMDADGRICDGLRYDRALGVIFET